MITKEAARDEALKILRNAGIVLTKEEKEKLDVEDYGLGDLEHFGTQKVVYINTPRYCAKEIVLLPNQICLEHCHPPFGGNPGKQETFRCRWGEVYLYVPGKAKKKIKARIPKEREEYFTVRNEIVLKPGEQYTIKPNTKHWFQAGPKGAIVSEFSSMSTDEKDIFTDPQVSR
jgi:D-lyxose ketol-isomerase